MAVQKIDINKLQAYKQMPAITSSDQQWLKWMELLVKEYGEESATSIFIATWLKRGSKSANTFMLRSTLKNNYDIVIDETAFDKIVDIGNGIGNTISGIFKIGKYTVLVVGGVIIIAGVALLANVIKTGKIPMIPKIGGK